MALPIVAVLCVCLAIVGAQRDAYELVVQSLQEYPLPELPYAYDGLEPFLDAATLRVHHQGHHKAYTSKMNVALKEWREHVSRSMSLGQGGGAHFCFPSYQEPDSPLAQASIAKILWRISEVPSSWQTRLRNNGGGYFNHILYWCTMCQDTRPEPEGELKEAIEQQFSNFSNFQTEFSQEATGLFGSGYVWLCETDTSPPELKIVSTQNQVWWHYRPGTPGGINLTITLPPLPGLSSLRQAASTVGLGRVGTCLLSEAPE